MKQTSPYVQLAFTELDHADNDRLLNLWKALKDDRSVQPNIPTNDSRKVKKYQALVNKLTKKGLI